MVRRAIRVLPPALADQIAAGEVVERPASVVKELVENALDAGARRIDLEIEGGGRRLIRVVDDGSGLGPDDARLALRRHATSKIEAADDLWGLVTFGFRGEALPSIAAVSRLTLLSRARGDGAAVPDADVGFKLTVEAGVETDAREAGVPLGTQVEVRDLFFNTPARAKFLKAESTEEANIYEAVLRLGLAHPDVHLRLKVKGAVRLDLPPHRDLAERVRASLARRGAGALHEARGEEGSTRVRAFLADPEAATTTARATYLFVGGRAIRDRSLLHAVSQAYGTLLEKGRYPLAAVFLDVVGSELDVNVHPQKLEVRFARAQEVYAAVRHVLAAALARAPWLEAAQASVAASRAQPMRAFTLPPSRGERAPAYGESGAWAPIATPQGTLPLRARDAAIDPEPQVGAEAAAVDEAPRLSPFFSGLSYIGQLHRTYLVCESSGPGGDAGALVLIDQHAAHERVAYARLVAAHGRREVRRQRLLFPLPIEVDELAAAVVDGAGAETVAALGFEVTRTGPRSVRLSAVPELLKDADPKPLVREVLGQLAEGDPAADRHEGIDHVLATMACHSVVRAGDVLARSEAVGLLAQLDEVDLRSHCPHGRPVMLRLPLAEIERRFGRV
ncbi:MAG TPA: DNA mismatch repair endonuclease MutL [Polyangia bacterium]|nr:DNA mismatch repair endonuclease MutL [Polyangia bacterium]